MEDKYICEYCKNEYSILNKIPHQISCKKKFDKRTNPLTTTNNYKINNTKDKDIKNNFPQKIHLKENNKFVPTGMSILRPSKNNNTIYNESNAIDSNKVNDENQGNIKNNILSNDIFKKTQKSFGLRNKSKNLSQLKVEKINLNIIINDKNKINKSPDEKFSLLSKNVNENKDFEFKNNINKKIKVPEQYNINNLKENLFLNNDIKSATNYPNFNKTKNNNNINKVKFPLIQPSNKIKNNNQISITENENQIKYKKQEEELKQKDIEIKKAKEKVKELEDEVKKLIKERNDKLNEERIKINEEKKKKEIERETKF